MKALHVLMIPLVLPACLSASDFPGVSDLPPCAGKTCPDGMVHALVCGGTCTTDPTPEADGRTCFCIDAYEASNEGGRAASVEGATPWAGVTWTEAKAACEAASKRLCTIREWIDACKGYVLEADFTNQQCVTSGSVVPTGQSQCEGGYPGLFDMSGNVSEWVGNLTSSSSCHTEWGCELRGGSVDDSSATRFNCGDQNRLSTTDTFPAGGFRCCADLQ